MELAPSYAESYVWLGWLHLYLGRPEAGLPSAERAVELDPLAPAYRVYLAENSLANGKADAALRQARAREGGEQIDRTEAPFSKGPVHAALGDTERAFECFEQVRDWGSFTTEHARYFFPDVLGPPRENPRYDELLRTINEYWGLNPDGSLPEDVELSEETLERP